MVFRASNTRLRVSPAIAPLISIRAICLRDRGLNGQIMGNDKTVLN